MRVVARFPPYGVQLPLSGRRYTPPSTRLAYSVASWSITRATTLALGRPEFKEVQVRPLSTLRTTPSTFVDAYRVVGVAGSIRRSLTEPARPLVLDTQVAPLLVVRYTASFAAA